MDSVILNPNIASIIFKCSCRTKIGENLRVVGNIEELGCWDANKALTMLTTAETFPIWTSNKELTGPVGMEVQYKYVIWDQNLNQYIWEQLPNNMNRKVVISNSGVFEVNDEFNSLHSYFNKIKGVSKEEENSQIFNDFSFTNQVDNFIEYRKISPIFESNDIYNTLNYEPNQFNGNDINETINFCLSQKVTGDDRIIIATAHLPFEIERTSDNKFVIKVTDENLIYSILYRMKESDFCEVIWVGMLNNYSDFTDSELHQIDEFLQEKNIYMVQVSDLEYKNYWIYMNRILSPIFIEGTIDMYK